MIDWNQLGGMATVAATVGGAVIGGIWRLWTLTRDKFDAQDTARAEQLKTIKTDVLTAFSKHEDLDKERHDDNLRKFERQNDLLTDIRLKLARAGINGHDDSC